MRDYYILKDKLPALANVRVLKVWKGKKKVTANVTILCCSEDWPKSVKPIP